MEKVKLTRVYTTNKDKQGNALMSRNNKPYTRMSIQCTQYGTQWLSGFQNQSNQNWKEGDEVEIIVKKDGQYMNFEVPKIEDKVNSQVGELSAKMDAMNSKLNAIWEVLKSNQPQVQKKGPETIEYPDEDINPESIPF